MKLTTKEFIQTLKTRKLIKRAAIGHILFLNNKFEINGFSNILYINEYADKIDLYDYNYKELCVIKLDDIIEVNADCL